MTRWLLPALALFGPAYPQDSKPPPRPPESGLVERAAARLAQIDVTVTGKPDAIAGLTARDFEVTVGGREVSSFSLDGICTSGPEEPSRAAGPSAPPPGSRPATYLFYFDQPHLSFAGRGRAIELTRELLPRLVSGGSRAMIASNSQRLRAYSSFTGSVPDLLSALDRMEKDGTQTDAAAGLEPAASGELDRFMFRLAEEKRFTPPFGCAASGRFDRFRQQLVTKLAELRAEESQRVRQNMKKLILALKRLSEVIGPKAFIYYGDTLRSKPGAHFVDQARRSRDGQCIVGMGLGEASAVFERRFDNAEAAFLFKKIVDAADAEGVRFYTIEAHGLAATSDAALRDAQDTLRDMALETGGQAFLNGAPASRIEHGIRQDLGCTYLVSFQPKGFPEDVPLSVGVTIRRPGVRARTRSRIVIASEKARMESRLLAAFLTPEAVESDFPVEASLIPLSWEKGKYTALLQISVLPPPGVLETSWDIGASVVEDADVSAMVRGRVSVGKGAIPLVYEQEIQLSGGPTELVVVARELGLNATASTRLAPGWPAPRKRQVVVTPVALVQPATALFVRGSERRSSGSRARSEGSPVSPREPIALVSLVCRGEKERMIRVLRRLAGEDSVSFPEMEISDSSGECFQIRDVIPENTLGPGSFDYEIEVHDEAESLVRGGRSFQVGGAGYQDVQNPEASH